MQRYLHNISPASMREAEPIILRGQSSAMEIITYGIR